MHQCIRVLQRNQQDMYIQGEIYFKELVHMITATNKSNLQSRMLNCRPREVWMLQFKSKDCWCNSPSSFPDLQKQYYYGGKDQEETHRNVSTQKNSEPKQYYAPVYTVTHILLVLFPGEPQIMQNTKTFVLVRVAQYLNDKCYGLNCTPSKFICWSSSPQNLRM